MVDFPDTSMFPIQPVSRAIENSYEDGSLQKKRRPVRKPERVEEIEDTERGEQKHSLDLDA